MVLIQGETCCDKEGKLYHNFLMSELKNDVHVRSVRIGNTTEDDFTNSLTVHPFHQVINDLNLSC